MGTPNIQRLGEILSYKRPHGSASEAEMVEKIITSQYEHLLLGPMGNVVIVTDPDSKTLFSCHTDTVHRTEGRQTVHQDDKGFWLKQDGEPLGADDGAGVWLLLHMIDAGVPGTYIFHRGEERGGIGSRWLAECKADWLVKFERAVAFDRRGSTSVITHQFGGRCCSDEFATALSEDLGMEHEPDNTGSFTDTANYTHLIAECSNVSIGYANEHTKDEQLDTAYLLKLAEVVVELYWEALPTERDPRDITRASVFGGMQDLTEMRDLDDLEGIDLDTLAVMIEEQPEVMAMLVMEFFEERQFKGRSRKGVITLDDDTDWPLVGQGGFDSPWPLDGLEDELDLQATGHLRVGMM